VNYPAPLQNVIDEIGRFPGIGPKSAQRIAFWLMRQPSEDVQRLAGSLDEMVTALDFCERCCNVAEVGGLCPVCRDARRDGTVICVVESPTDMSAVERSGAFHGTYHVLHGLLNPLEGVTPERLKIQELLQRLTPDVHEVIICLSPTLEGDATAMYLRRLLQLPDLRVTRPASGLPVGGDLEFADDVTLSRAFEGRRDVAD
jgi:recombination protein RecR